MTFTKYKNTQFYLTDETNVVVLYISKAYGRNVIELEDVLKQFFLCIFLYDGVSVNQLDTPQPLLDQVVVSGRGIVWFQDADPTIDIEGRPTIGIDKDGHCSLGIDLKNNITFTLNSSAGTINIAAKSDNFLFTVSDSMAIFTNDNYSFEFTEFSIPINGTDTGSVQVSKIKGPLNNRLQPVSSFIDNKNRILDVEYFSQRSFNKVDDQTLSYFPYPKGNLVEGEKFQSYINHTSANGIATNILDEKGRQLQVKGDFMSKLSIIEYKVGNKVYTYHRFIPVDNFKYVIGNQSADDTSTVLLGYSGTERIDLPGSGTLKFVTRQEIKFDDQKNDLTTSERSLSSGPSIDKDAFYFLDSEKKSLFRNDIDIKHLGSDASREIPYLPIPIKKISGNKAIPIVPTLLHQTKNNLLELENVLAKVRLKDSTKALSDSKLSEGFKNYITPQGFLRKKDAFDFIKTDSVTNKDATTTNLEFLVDGVTITSDFYLSLCKEDVFFVLTPEMIKNQAFVTISVNFKINGFTVELKEFNTPGSFPTLQNDTFVIFKFSRHSFADLLRDFTKWSNYGSYKPSAADAAKLIATITEKTTFPKNDDYEYFNETIVKDSNWSGVVIINVPIADRKNLPLIFDGLSGSQDLAEHPETSLPVSNDERLKLKTGLKFQYVAFPVNKTAIQTDGTLGINSTSFYGVIDYDLLNKSDSGHTPSDDYKTVSDHFPKAQSEIETYKFILSKLLVRFENAGIKNFQSYAFLQIPELFDNNVEFGKLSLSHPGMPQGDEKPNLVRLDGQYQKNSAGNDEFNFAAQADLTIRFEDGNILESIDVFRMGFTYSEGTEEFRFDIDAKANFKKVNLDDLFSFDELQLQNIGIKFQLGGIKLPKLKFDLSKLIVLPKINFDGKGLLKSFPIRFSHFQGFKFKRKDDADDFEFGPDFDFFKLPKFKFPAIGINVYATLFSFIFDIDLGSLGNLEALKALKGQLLIGWSFKGGFVIAFKFSGPSQGLHVDFGAVKLDITELNLCSFEYIDPDDHQKYTSYYLRLVNARLTIFGKELPDPKDFDFNGIIYANPFGGNGNSKVAWFIAATKKDEEDPDKDKLILGFGQRVGLDVNAVSSVQAGIDNIKAIFQARIGKCEDDAATAVKLFYRPDRNILIGTEAILPKDWGITFKAIFNDPVLYGARLGIDSTGFELEILYKRLSDNLGVYSVEIQLPDAIRSYDTGAAYFRLPNIGIDIFTNGDWRVDIGFPKGDNWLRSGFIQLRTVPPFVGWFGFYLMQSKVASLTLFKDYISDEYSKADLNIIQAGFAMRVGLGAYIDGGVFYIGASISVYGILEGAFAFKKENGLAKFFPNHFAVLGRVGAIAEVVVYVDFFIIQASAEFRLQVEYGMLLVYLSEPGSVINPSKPNQQSGIQPVKVYVEGTVVIRLTVKIGCIKFRLDFEKSIRFEYTIGGDGDSKRLKLKAAALFPDFTRQIQVVDIEINNITDVPMAYLPAFSKVNEQGNENLLMIHSFFIPFFGKSGADDVKFSNNNIIKTKIIKPFFEDLIAQLQLHNIPDADTYETLRTILLNLPDSLYKANISIPNYTPTFISGINSQTKDEIEKILKNHFLFDDSEIQPCDATGNCQPIVDTYKDSLRIIQAPVSTRIKIVDKDNTTLYSTTAGFKLNVDGLVNNEAGTSATITSDISAILKNDEDLENMERFYDDYKMQFIDRKKNQRLKKFAGIPKDIRTNVVIAEFFKLLSLLTLEAFYDAINPKDKKGEKINPAIKIDADGWFNYVYTIKDKDGNNQSIPGRWDPNKAFEESKVIEQLNYFYNSGLRIPSGAADKTTESLYQILKQSEKITPITGGDWRNVKINIDNYDITNDVFGATDAAREANIAGPIGMWKYIDGFKSADFLENLKKEFDPTDFKFVKPFEWIPVTLAIQTGRLDIGDPVQSKFFELPGKLSQHAKPGSNYYFGINYANSELQVDGQDNIEYSTLAGVGNPAVQLETVVCLNIEIKIRKQADRIVEISNVFVDDLNLAFAIRNSLSGDDSLVKRINFYYKPDEKDPNKNIELTSFVTNRATILKTNLSPRTSPPVFSADKRKFSKSADDQRKYLADSDTETASFANLLWEALTTNNGGYFLVFDKELPQLDFSEKTLIVSFETEMPDKGIPAYFNCFKLNNKPAYREIFDSGLAEKKHYFFIDHIQTDGKEVKEFHPTIPAHTFSFQVRRNKENNLSENTSHYLPLEFNLQEKDGNIILNRNKVLPIMPTNPVDEEHLQYNHVTPLVNKNSDPGHHDDVNNIYSRYAAIGKEYILNYDLRDTYGFRTSKDNHPINTVGYRHFYFDKIIPVESWPFIKFSHWLNKDSTREPLVFDLRADYSLLEMLDSAGVKRKADGSYRYILGEEITEADDRFKLYRSLINSKAILYTICAQLYDPKSEVEISYWNDSAERNAKSDVLNLVRHLTEIIDKIFVPVSGKFYMPLEEDPLVFPLELTLDPSIKKELSIFVRISRPQSFTLSDEKAGAGVQFDYDPKDLKDDSLVWDYNTTWRSTSAIKPHNPAKTNSSTIADLNEVIRTKTLNSYALGISSNEETKVKIVYIINEGKLSEIAVSRDDLKGNTFDQAKCYFGIKPFSNKLWAGDYLYQPGQDAPQKESFSNIDLDRALRVVLAKIDELLKAKYLNHEVNGEIELKDLYEQLVFSKKSLVEQYLKNKVDWVMENPTKRIDEIRSDIVEKAGQVLKNRGIPLEDKKATADAIFHEVRESFFSTDKLMDEFRSLLLSELNNFYSYDGIIKTSLTGLEILNAGSNPGDRHRLNVNLSYDKDIDEENKDYNLRCSKFGYKNENEWYVFFDQKENIKGNIAFSVVPEITHIEFDIAPIVDEIEHSTWIQLITPIRLKDNGGRFRVDKWEKIIRYFPERPVIGKHQAVQKYPNSDWGADTWLVDKIGLWNYELELRDFYSEGDIVRVDLLLQTSRKKSVAGEMSDLNAFIAFWSSRILKTDKNESDEKPFDWQLFVKDLFKQFSGTKSKMAAPAGEEHPYFELKKNSDGKWGIQNVSGDIKTRLKLKDNILGVSIEDFDIFSKNKTVYSISPEIKVLRNKGVNNPDFWYETEAVRPVNPATPHIKYFDPIMLSNTATAFETLVFTNLKQLPFKATAKYLINTDKDFPGKNHFVLPIIPVKQIECKTFDSSQTQTDVLFDGYENGYPAFSLTIYNNQLTEDADLPVFYSETIVKK